MKVRSGFIFIIIICLTLIGCIEKSQVHVDGENYKEMYESNLGEVEALQNKINELEKAKEDLLLKLNEFENSNNTINKLEKDIKTLELILKKREVNIGMSEVNDAPSTKELRKIVFSGAKMYQKFFLSSNVRTHGDKEKEQNDDIYKIDGNEIEQLKGYYLVIEENINTLSDLTEVLEKTYTRKAINDFLDIYRKDNMTILNNGNYIEYNGLLFSALGAVGKSPYDKVHIDETEFELCGVTTDGNNLIYKMILPIAQLDVDGQIEDVDFKESFIEMVRDYENIWRLNDFIIIEDYIYSEEFEE
ncbi:MAG: hypothetical protein MJA31_15785 [Clostridia bacterium]|nr:hypothetical protein [Clostridia bacterium]